VLCSERSLLRHGDGQTAYKPLPCKRWSCEYCAPTLRKRLVRRAEAGQPTRLLTLTVNPREGVSAAHRYQALHAAWRTLAKRMAKYLRVRRIEYMAFVERTDAGEPHLHILLRCGYVPQAWISAAMSALIAAPIVDIRAIKGAKHAATYVTKYVAKGPEVFGRSRRFWATRRWCLQPLDRYDGKPVLRSWDELLRQNWCEFMRQRVSARFTWKISDMGWYHFYRPGEVDGAGYSGTTVDPWRSYSRVSRDWL
jgi:hypothetical protein